MSSEGGALRRPIIVGALLLSLVMTTMEITIVATAMPSIAGQLHGVHLYSWVFTGYLLSSTVTVPLYGTLADMWGRKPAILVGIALFSSGSLACGFAGSMAQLVGFRMLQGLGAGAIHPISLTIIGDIYKVQERWKAQALLASVWVVSAVGGPVLGGYLVAHWSWRWVFLISVPFGILSSIVLAVLRLRESPTKGRSFDLLGALLLFVASACTVYGSSGRKALWAFLLAAALLFVFVRVEAKVPEPIVPLQLLRTRLMVTANALSAIAGALMLSVVTYIPLYVQSVLGRAPAAAGAAMTPLVIFWPTAATLGGWILPRVGYTREIRVGSALCAIATITLAMFIRVDHSLWITKASVAALGTGLGLTYQTQLIAVQKSVAWRQRGIVTAGNLFFRNMGGMLAVGLLGSILETSIGRAPPSAHSRAAFEPIDASAMSGGLSTIFWAIAVVASTGFVLSFLFPTLDHTSPQPQGASAHEGA